MKNPLKRDKSKVRSPTAKSQIRRIFFGNSDSDDFPIGYIRLSECEEIKRCVYKIADLVSDMTIMLMENGENGDKRIKDNLSRMIDVTPSINVTRKILIHRIVTDMCLKGNCVCYPETNEKGYLTDIQIMNDRTFYQVGNSYEVRSKGKIYKPDDILNFILNPDSKYIYLGDGFLPLVKNTVENIAQANATKKGFLKSKWKPSLIIAVQSDIEELENEDTRHDVLKSYTDTTEAGEPWVIPAGEVSVQTVQPLTLNDLAIQDSLKLDIKQVACAIGIPPFMVGVGDFKLDEYNNFISTTIMSFATIIQQELTNKILIKENRYWRFNPKSLLQYSLTDKMSYVKEMVSGGMFSRNEGRNEFDISPVDDAGMNDYIVLENYVPVDKVGDQKKLVQGGEKKDAK